MSDTTPGITFENPAYERATARFFPPQTPTDEKRAHVEELRQRTVPLAAAIEELVPNGRLKSASLTSLETALMQATRGVYAPSEIQTGDPHHESPQPPLYQPGSDADGWGGDAPEPASAV